MTNNSNAPICPFGYYWGYHTGTFRVVPSGELQTGILYSVCLSQRMVEHTLNIFRSSHDNAAPKPSSEVAATLSNFHPGRTAPVLVVTGRPSTIFSLRWQLFYTWGTCRSTLFSCFLSSCLRSIVSVVSSVMSRIRPSVSFLSFMKKIGGGVNSAQQRRTAFFVSK
jgi:hypothetical protein